MPPSGGPIRQSQQQLLLNHRARSAVAAVVVAAAVAAAVVRVTGGRGVLRVAGGVSHCDTNILLEVPSLQQAATIPWPRLPVLYVEAAV